MNKGYTIMVCTPHYRGQEHNNHFKDRDYCIWTVVTFAYSQGSAVAGTSETHEYPVKPTKRQLRQLKQVTKGIIAEDLLK